MYVEEFFSNGLSHAAYYLESDGKAAVIDPLHDVAEYIQLAETRNARIVYIFETGFHADFVAGHLALASKTGATIVYGPGADPDFPAVVARNNEVFTLGEVTVTASQLTRDDSAIHCFLVHNETARLAAIFTGDGQLTGYKMVPGLQPNPSAPPPLDVVIYSRQGSSIARNCNLQRTDAAAYQHRMNYVLSPISVDEFEKKLQYTHAVVIDTRCPEKFCKAFIPGSINIGLRGRFAYWAAMLFSDLKRPVIIVGEKTFEKEAAMRLAGVGIDHVIGYLDKGFDAWYQSKHPIDWIITITPTQLAEEIANGCNLVDVRETSEYEREHLRNAVNIPLSQFRTTGIGLDPGRLYYVYCGSGYRSVLFISLMNAKGYTRLVNVGGGLKGFRNESRIELVSSATPY